MRKLYFIMAAMMLGFALQTKAANVEVKIDETCAQWFEGYKMSKIYDFVNWTINGEPINEEGSWIQSNDAAAFKVNNWNKQGQTVYPVTTDKLTHIYVYGNDIRPRTVITDNGKACGIFNFASGGRVLSFADMKKGMIIVVQGGTNDSKKDYWTGTYVSTSASEWCVEITDSIHAIQAEADADEDGVADGTNDGLRYFKMIEDGRFDLVFERSNWIAAYGVIADMTAAEYVTAPSLKLVGVADDTRNIELKPGESSYGNAVTTWYSIDDTDPITLESTGEIASIDTMFVTDENGEVFIDSTTMEPIILSIDTTYVMKPVYDEEFGMWGELEYNPEDGMTVDISSYDDLDGDGYVTIKVASITDNGVMSEIVELNVGVGIITLNQPTLTLVGMEGTMRQYKIGWDNNTICGEPFIITYENGEGEASEEMNIGDIVASAQSLTVTVSVAGYADGVTILDSVANEGIEYTRKNTELAAEGIHDWDFQIRPADDYAKIKREILDYAYIVNEETGDTTKYTQDIIDAGEIDIPESATYVYKDFNWWFDSGKGRATLNVLVDTIWQDTTIVVDGVEVDTTLFTLTNARYAEDLVGLFDNGLTVDCPPNANNASCIFIYTDSLADRNADLGVYFMSKATISIADLEYGEYVITSLGKGGSNYTNTRWTECDMVPVEGFTKNLSASIHLFYIDIYTSENLPDAIDKVAGSEANFANVYSIDGRVVRRNANIGTALNGLHKGIYIMNGKKYLVK